MTQVSSIQSWLTVTHNESNDKRYEHILIVEKPEQRSAFIAELQQKLDEAHEDARQRLRAVSDINLDPLDLPFQRDLTSGYPEQLPLQTLKGYFGEFFAGYIAINLEPLGHRWEVPAYLFRYHDLAFDQLEKWRQTGTMNSNIVGRTGDDCLAFERDPKGKIRRSLVCEAKCTKAHDNSLLTEAHTKLSDDALSVPISLRQMIEILKSRGDEQSGRWVSALQQLLLTEILDPYYERCDFVSYVCGQAPKNSKTWIPTTKPHNAYTRGRRLSVAEIHLTGVEDMIREAYTRKKLV